jgi:hypothetical protein
MMGEFMRSLDLNLPRSVVLPRLFSISEDGKYRHMHLSLVTMLGVEPLETSKQLLTFSHSGS